MNSRDGTLAVVVLGLMFGSSMVASRFLIGIWPAQSYVGIRLGLAALLHLAIYLVLPGRSWPRDRRLWRHAGVLGLFGSAIPMTATISGLVYQSSGLTSLLLTLNPAVTVLFAHAMLGDEPLSRRKLAGIGLAFAGAAFLFLQGETGLGNLARGDWRGYALVAVGIVSSAFATVYTRRHLREADNLDVASIRLWVAAPVVLAFAAATSGFHMAALQPIHVGALLYATVVGTFLALLLSLYIIQHYGATTASLTTYIIPVMATLLGSLLLHEHVTGVMVLGMVLIFGGLALVQLPARQAVAVASGS